MSSRPHIKIQEIHVRTGWVPLKEPHRTASGVMAESPLVLTDIVASDGTTVHSRVVTYTPFALKATAELIMNWISKD